MSHWSVESWVTLLGAMGVLSGVIATGVVKVITALQQVSGKVDALEIKVDGRLTQLLERTAGLAHAEGVEAGRGLTGIINPSTIHPIPIPLPVVVVEDKGE